jgi:hypothetical protein
MNERRVDEATLQEMWEKLKEKHSCLYNPYVDPCTCGLKNDLHQLKDYDQFLQLNGGQWILDREDAEYEQRKNRMKNSDKEEIDRRESKIRQLEIEMNADGSWTRALECGKATLALLKQHPKYHNATREFACDLGWCISMSELSRHYDYGVQIGKRQLSNDIYVAHAEIIEENFSLLTTVMAAEYAKETHDSAGYTRPLDIKYDNWAFSKFLARRSDALEKFKALDEEAQHKRIQAMNDLYDRARPLKEIQPKKSGNCNLM